MKSPFNYEASETRKLVECEEFWDVNTYVKDENKCFLFAFKDLPGQEFVYDLNRLKNTFGFRTLLASIRFNPEVLGPNVEKAFLRFHPRHRFVFV